MKPTSTNITQDSAADTNSNPVVISSARARARSRRLADVMVVMAVIVAMIIMGFRGMRMPWPCASS